MTAVLATLTDTVGTAFAVGFVVFLRVGAVMALLPAFGEQMVPMRIRLALGLAFTAVVAPAVAPEVAPLIAAPPARLLATEPVAGLVLALALRFMVMALQIAGTMAAQATSLSQILGAASVDPQPAIAQLLLVAGLALVAMAGLHVHVARALIESYTVLRPGMLAPAAMLADWGLAQVRHAFGLAFSLAAPFTLAAVVYNLALGAINRAMPQLMVAFVGAPALTAGGLALLLSSAPLALSVWLEAFRPILADPFGMPP